MVWDGDVGVLLLGCRSVLVCLRIFPKGKLLPQVMSNFKYNYRGNGLHLWGYRVCLQSRANPNYSFFIIHFSLKKSRRSITSRNGVPSPCRLQPAFLGIRSVLVCLRIFPKGKLLPQVMSNFKYNYRSNGLHL